MLLRQDPNQVGKDQRIQELEHYLELVEYMCHLYRSRLQKALRQQRNLPHDEKNEIKLLKERLEALFLEVKIVQRKINDREKELKDDAYLNETKADEFRAWVDDGLSLLTNGIRLKDSSLLTCSTIFAGANSSWKIYQTIKNENLEQRYTRLGVEVIKILVFLTTNILSFTFGNDPTMLTLRTTLVVLTMVMDIYKHYYISSQLKDQIRAEKKMKVEEDQEWLAAEVEKQIQAEKKEAKQQQVSPAADLHVNASECKSAEVKKYPDDYKQFHSEKLNKLRKELFDNQRSLFFDFVGFLGYALMPAATALLLWQVAITGATIITVATIFEILDRRTGVIGLNDYLVTKEIAAGVKNGVKIVKEEAKRISQRVSKTLGLAEQKQLESAVEPKNHALVVKQNKSVFSRSAEVRAKYAGFFDDRIDQAGVVCATACRRVSPTT